MWFVMASNCQLCGLDHCSGGHRAAQHPALRRATRLSTLALLLFTAACGDDAGSTDASTGDATSDATTSDASSSPTTLTSSSSPTTGATDEPGTTTATTGDPGVVGPHFGLLTFTLYPADAAGAPVLLGMAGAWRTTAFTTDDFYAVHALGLHFPLAPAAADTLESHEPQVYEWGKAETWVALGNGVRLTHAGGDALACLELVADSYPVYFSDDAPIFDPSCAPDPAQWLPATAYDLVSYGGETYADQTRTAAVTTPTALVVTAPGPASVTTSAPLRAASCAHGVMSRTLFRRENRRQRLFRSATHRHHRLTSGVLLPRPLSQYGVGLPTLGGQQRADPRGLLHTQTEVGRHALHAPVDARRTAAISAVRWWTLLRERGNGRGARTDQQQANHAMC